MSQPDWKLAANLGDVNPIDHGGFFVFLDATGVYPPEIEVWKPVDDTSADETTAITAYRVVCEPHTHVNGVLSNNPYHPAQAAWYADELESVCRSMDSEIEDLISGLCGRKVAWPEHGWGNVRDAIQDAVNRAAAYQTMIGYFGAYQFDQEPRTITRAEAEATLDKWRKNEL